MNTIHMILTYVSAKMFKKVLIVCALSLFCGQVFARSDCAEYLMQGAFRCKNADKQIVTIFGAEYKCAVGTLCNYLYLLVNSTCSPCVEPKLLCGDKFTCLDKTSFKMGLSQFNCPENYICNSDLKTSCKPCIEKPYKHFNLLDMYEPLSK